MADETQRRIIYLEVNATKAVDGSTAATNALAAVGKSASSAGAAMSALEAASASVGGATAKTALDLAAASTAAANLNAAYRTTTSGVLELTRATTSASASAASQAAGFARMAEQKTLQAALAETRTLMDSVARSTNNLSHIYGSATAAASGFATAQSQASGYARLAEQRLINASTAKTQATMGAVDALTPDQIKAFYYGSGASSPAVPSVPGAAGRTPLTAYQRLNLSYQLNDVFTSLVGGASPFTVAAQQGPQISQIFGGVGGLLGAIPKPALVAGGGILAGLGVAAAISSLKDLADALDAQKRKLGDMLGEQRLSAQAYSDIAKQATAAGQSISEVTTQYAQFTRSGVFVGATGGQVAGLTSIVSQVGRLGGSTPEEQSAGSAALSRALKESVVSAGNLDAILESMPGLGHRIADGLGLSVTQLRLMTSTGQITNRQVFDALLSQQDKVSAKFKEAGITVGGFFSAMVRDAEDLAVSIYKSVTGLELVASKVEAARRATAANPNRPTPATPRVIGNSGSSLSLEEMILSGESGQTDASILNGATKLTTQFLDLQRAARSAADEAVLSASKIADSLDPLTADMRTLQQQTDAVAKGLNALQTGMTGLDASKAAQETKRLTDGLQILREKADAAGDAYYQALKAVQDRQQQDELGMTPGQRSYNAKVGQLAPAGSGKSIEEAQTVVDAQQIQMLDDMIAKQALELTTQTAITAAMRSGKKAADDAAVAMQVLGISFEQLGKMTPELQVKLDVLAETLGQIREQARAQASIDASKPLIAELDGITAAMANVTNGAFAMKRAQAEAKAAHDENGTAGLQMEIFDQNQALTDATTVHGLSEQIKLTDALAAAAGDLAKQKAIQLDYDIKIATQAAGPGAREAIEAGLRVKAAADLNREVKDGLADMERQNDLAQQQLDIIRTGAPDVAVQLAAFQKRNDLLAKGIDIAGPDAQKQIALAGNKAQLDEQIQLAKDAADATKRTWQNAYDNIQSSAADTFYDIFNGAGFNAQSAAEAMKKVFLRTFAEIAAAAIIRPLITPIFQFGAEAGLIPSGVIPSATGSYGGAGLGGGGVGSLFSGGGLGSIFSSGGSAGTGWLARQFSGVSDFFGSPVSSLFRSSSAPAGGFANVGDLIASGQTGASAAATGGLSIGGALGGIGSIGMGAYGLLKGGGGTASTIGSIGQIAGGVMMMIPGLQPFGAALSILSGILPGLFGDGPKIPPQPALAYGAGQFRSTGAGAYSYGGDSLGSGSPMTATATTIAGDLTTAFRTAGLSIVPSALIGGNIASGTDHVLSGQQWQDRPYTEAGLILPGGSYEGLTYNDSSRNTTQASEYLLAQAFKANVLRGGVTGAGAGLKAGLETINPTTKADLDNVIAMGTAYDALGKTLNPAKTAIDKITASFDSLKDYATQAGLSLEPINDELKKQSVRSAQDFIDKMVDPLAVSLRALDDDKAAALESAKYIRDNIKGVNVDINAIVDYYGKERVRLEDQYYGGAITDLKTLIDSLTPGGKLSGLDPTSTLAGLKATYDTTLAGARKGDVQSVADLASVAGNYADYAQTYYAGSTDYTAIRDAILAAIEEERAAIQGGTTTTTTNGTTTTETSAAVKDLIALQQRTQAALDDVLAQLRESSAATTKNNNLTSRLLTTKV